MMSSSMVAAIRAASCLRTLSRELALGRRKQTILESHLASLYLILFNERQDRDDHTPRGAVHVQYIPTLSKRIEKRLNNTRCRFYAQGRTVGAQNVADQFFGHTGSTGTSRAPRH